MKHLLLVLTCLLSLPCLADSAIEEGPSSVLPLQTATYRVRWGAWGDDFENNATVTWNVQHGFLLSYDKHSVTVQWDDPMGPQGLQGRIDVTEDMMGQTTYMNVEVLGTSPSTFCDGVLGPAVVAVDFGSGSNPGPALPAGATTYAYNSSCAISPNQYTRTNNSVNCRAPWHNIVEDHTPGDTNGYFLMVDAASQAGEFYKTTVQGLIPAFKYEFSVWVGNLDKNAIYEAPRLRFEIRTASGFVATSGDIVIPPSSPFQWQKVGFMFELPPGVTSAEVVLVNRNQNDIGNDLVIDDISFAPCYPAVIASFQNGVVVDRNHTCNSGATSLHAWWPSTIPFSTPVYQWQRSFDNGESWLNIPGATTLHASQSEPTPGIYRYRLRSHEATNPAQFVVSNPLTYFVQRLTVEPRTHHLYACSGGTASGSLPVSYQLEFSDPTRPKSYQGLWSPATYLSGPNNIPNYIVLPSLGTSPPPNGPPVPAVNHVYTVTVTDNVSTCSGSAQQTVAQYNPRKVAIPNAFTPNGDGNNDLFRPLNLEDYPGSGFFIYNRYGQLIFSSRGPTRLDYSWDGRFQGADQPSGNYVWRIEMSDCHGNIINGTTGDNTPHGSAILIR
ncbi:gliding motility-associated C-terminal domain-containing protein [Myxococcus landrumensis]|uniref:Gliding motility-associated C-terminal domain-containing protein n=1 Tax=Myxococcus landrumensis TaxID=2813577 RepID=A0ABX7NB89_9BACT|nr:gliding motility-associated C-terminal domain-containing protein [Myxococcus landrumus]QSQ15688.1 gliding motility-associated C-terminal domain-containing protein [Myxococcus landrumus]